MNLQNRIEFYIISFIAAICVIIPILDFIGALDSIGWLSQRVPIMTLLAIGTVALYLVSQHRKSFSNLSTTIEENTNRILAKVTVDETNQKILDTLNDLWEEREGEFERIFKSASEIQTSNENEALKKFLGECEANLDEGIILGTKLWEIWDVNIIAIDLTGKVLYHSHEPSISKRYSKDHPAWQILEKRNGIIFWPNNLYGKLAKSTGISYNRLGKDLRLTKIYFKEIQHLGAIVMIQSHINILPFINQRESSDSK